MAVPEPRIITCNEWGAAPARRAASPAGKPERTIFHHTAGYAGVNKAAYMRMIQRDMMVRRNWYDTGPSFFVMRDGSIYEGRRGTVAAIRKGEMVWSAHCPGQNDQPGVEHEHVRGDMTDEQFVASVKLHAWIADRCGIPVARLAQPHKDFYATDCPADLLDEIPKLRVAVARYMAQHDERNALRLKTLRDWLLKRRRLGWSWQRLKKTANWREYRRRGGR